jgi:hypothetical protein
MKEFDHLADLLSLVDAPVERGLPVGMFAAERPHADTPAAHDGSEALDNVPVGHTETRLHLDLAALTHIGVPAALAFEQPSGPSNLL